MSTIAKASEHIKPCNIAQSERHNRRDADYIASLNPSMLYIRQDLACQNATYVAPDMVGVSLQQHYDNIKVMVKQKTGRAMQEKDVEFTDKKGKKRVRQGCSPIREGVVNIKPDTTLDDLMRYAERVHERWGIRAIQIHMHKDEGHYENIGDQASWEPNLHAHIVWDWMDHSTGKSFKLNADDMSEMQDMVAETLAMERGQKKTETGADHLERNDFIIKKQENKIKQLQMEAEKAVAEEEDAEAEVKAAKKEVEAIHQHRDYLVETNRTKEERKKRLDSDIRAKENHSKELDETIKAKSENINELDEKEAEKLRDIYELRSRENWQDSVFLAISAYIYRIDEGFQFCIKAIQDYAFSGFKCRGGHHGEIFWDNESLGIKTFMKLFAELAATSLETVATWFVWLANKMAKFNDWELRRADREVHDIAKGRYDGRIQRFENHKGLSI